MTCLPQATASHSSEGLYIDKSIRCFPGKRNLPFFPFPHAPSSNHNLLLFFLRVGTYVTTDSVEGKQNPLIA